MTELEKSINEFIDINKKYNLIKTFNNNGKLFWPHNLPTSPELTFYYSNFPTIDVKVDTGFFPIKLFTTQNIESAQIGYKWIIKENDLRLNDSWPNEYLVVADDFGGGKPIIAVTNESQTPIFANYSAGKSFQIADNLSDFFKALTILIDIVYGKFNIFEITDDNDEVLPEFIKLIDKNIRPVLGDKNYSAFYDYFYG